MSLNADVDGDNTATTDTNTSANGFKCLLLRPQQQIPMVTLTSPLVATNRFVMTADYTLADDDLTVKRITTENGDADGTFAEFREIDASEITRNIESVQKKINNARVQAGSQYAALESAVIYTTDLTAQYELGYNTVHDVNFSMETAHLAKNQILQQAATAMLAQANQGQQGLLQLIQG